MITRTERNKEFYKQLNREIAKYTSLVDQNENIKIILEKLAQIDKNYFTVLTQKFLNNLSLEKPYLDIEKKDVYLPESAIYEIKSYLNELSKVELNIVNPKNVQDEDEGQKFYSTQSEQYQEELNQIHSWLDYQTEKYNKQLSKAEEYSNDIDMTKVQQIRNKDKRSLDEVLKNIKDQYDDIDKLNFKSRIKFQKTNRGKTMIAFLIISIVILFLVIIGFVLIAYL